MLSGKEKQAAADYVVHIALISDKHPRDLLHLIVNTFGFDIEKAKLLHEDIYALIKNERSSLPWSL